MSRRVAVLFATALAVTLVVTGCASEPGTGAIDQPSQPKPSATPAEPAGPTKLPATQEESCDWDSPRLDSGSADAPNGMGGDLATTLIGAWQHTHINEGAEFEPLKSTTDIRYVFPSTSRMLYCQDVKGATAQAENAVNIALDGVKIVLPSPSIGYDVMAWTNDTMVWKNNRDGSLYLLKRR
ncbi:MAG: hypothetical protein ABI238_03320 [Terrimesophilobacter sp.]